MPSSGEVGILEKEGRVMELEWPKDFFKVEIYVLS